MNHLLMSIRPQYSALIFSGKKRFELRRGRVRVSPGDVIWVYESSPTKAVVGAFTVARVLFDDLDSLWSRHSRWLGVSQAEYFAYFHGRQLGCAIEVAHRVAFEPISLDMLRRSSHGFRPPQSYMWCTAALSSALPAGAADQLQAVRVA